MKITLKNGEQFTLTVKRNPEQITSYIRNNDDGQLYFRQREGYKVVTDLGIDLTAYKTDGGIFHFIDAESGISLNYTAFGKREAIEQIINGIENQGGIDAFIQRIEQGRIDTAKHFGKMENVRSWYMFAYPSDNLGSHIKADITMRDVFNNLTSTYKKDIYEIIGMGDSIIRKRIFERLSIVYGMDYDRIYDLWIA